MRTSRFLWPLWSALRSAQILPGKDARPLPSPSVGQFQDQQAGSPHHSETPPFTKRRTRAERVDTVVLASSLLRPPAGTRRVKKSSSFRGSLPRASRILCGAVLLAQVLLPHSRGQDSQPQPLEVLIQTLGKIEDPAVQTGVLRGMNASLRGRHAPAVPKGWPELYERLKASPSETVREQAQALAAALGGGAALEELRKTLSDASAKIDARLRALESLLGARDAQTLPILLELMKQPGPLRSPALRGLANYEDAKIPEAVLAGYKTLDSTEKRDALNTLLGRPAGARALLAAIDAKTLDRGEISAPIARQLQSLRDPQIDAWLARNWGAMRTSPADKQKEIARLKQFLAADAILRADASHGRAIFTQTCAICHTLFGYGAKIGPELPGSFEDVDYLLLNIVDPNAIIGKDYQQTFVETKDGRTVSGIIASDDNAAVTLKTLAGPVVIQHADVASMEVSPNSLMPEGLLSALEEQSVRDLFLYLRQKGQVPMLATAANAGDFFNGGDLSRWHASPDGAWKVENGEIIGHGNAQKAASLISEMIAGDFDLTAQIKVTGSQPVAELAFRGRPDSAPFAGWSLSLGGASPPNLWQYLRESKPISQTLGASIKPGTWTRCEIISKGDRINIIVDGAVFSLAHLPATPERNGFGFFLQGGDAELRIKDLKLQIGGK